ncbi:MAG TPA: cytochrome c oxidase subunit II [Gemmatimonadales bacterium]|nr:cytochrome c oxidase subunit II [Gemmatimonadales bacterium]
MKAHVYEKGMLAVGLGVLVACAAALVYASVALGLHLPGRTAQIVPQDVYRVPPFNQTGVRQTGPNAYEVVMVAQAWAFVPGEVRVPVGSDVTFTATSVDIIHGLNVEGTRLNLMLIPGQVTRNSIRFNRPGEYLIICHEYCGIGHHHMFGKVVVEPVASASAGSSAVTTPGSLVR